ncbi:hypothetical protein H6S82_08780 [Planktothrix sp. FACHB-1355]|uniref:DUF2281 domain-containing protein n=1 Tax=Aerosakkonema funiforme FACHB-1375 TaxID=2949571 RepID=A0A926VGC2_9CYAN|nr:MULTISPECIES: hypothetical protein [Oscillatoriales]MBD2183208.1 hypothetical protein [Aerosakkonema funiforme FACHB-1375]MBD3558952.1 hypothetical protein [Planktothrix sp. FACHB-1355]
MQTQEPIKQDISKETSIRERLIKEIEQTPDPILAISLEFLLFLKSRSPQSSATEQQPPSTGASILKTLERIGKWEGDDLEECLELVHNSRSRIYIPAADAENEDSEEG